MNITHSASSLVSTLALIAAAAAQDPIAIIPPTVGAKAGFAFHSVQEQLIESGGESAEIKMELDQWLAIEVTAAGDDGSRTVKVTLLRVAGKHALPMQDEVAFDSDKPAEADDGLQAAAKALAGKGFTAKIDLDGKVSIEGFAETAKAARDAAGADAQWVDGMISDRALGGLVRAAFGPIPKAPVADGAKWTRTEESGAQLPVLRTLECTLSKHDDASAEIGVVGKIESMPGAKGAAVSDAKVDNGKIAAKTVMSRKDGFAATADSKAELQITANGGQVEVKVTITTKLERAEAKPAAAEPKKAFAGK